MQLTWISGTWSTQIARLMGPTWGPLGSYRPQMGPMWAPWNLLSGYDCPFLKWTAKTTWQGTRIAVPVMATSYYDHIAHDDVLKWKHFPLYWPFVREIPRSPVNSPNKGLWVGALVFSLICARINSWVNNREAGDLRRHGAHYDVIVMLGDPTVPKQGHGHTLSICTRSRPPPADPPI